MDQYLKALTGFAYYDALSWNPNREKSTRLVEWTRVMQEGVFEREEIIDKGEYSDYTQTLLCVARSRRYYNWLEYLGFQELPLWLSYQRDKDKLSKVSCLLLAKQQYPWHAIDALRSIYFSHVHYLSIVRVLGHFAGNNIDDIYQLITDVFKDVILTHGDPDTVLSACLYAQALYSTNQNRNSITKNSLIALLESFIAKFRSTSDFDDDIIHDYFNNLLDQDKYHKKWYACVHFIEIAAQYIRDDEKLSFHNLRNILYIAKGDYEGIMSTFIAIYSVFIQESDEMKYASIVDLQRDCTHFITTLYGSLLFLLKSDIDPLVYNSIQSFGYLRTLAYEEEAEINRTYADLVEIEGTQTIKERIAKHSEGMIFTLPCLSTLQILQKGDTSLVKDYMSNTCICSASQDTYNNPIYIFYNNHATSK